MRYEPATHAAVRHAARLVVVAALAMAGLVAGASPAGAAGCTVSKTLRLGMRNSQVYCAERTLRDQGFQSSYVDTYYGSTTVRSVKRFQTATSLPVTGVIDKATATALGIWLDPPPPPPPSPDQWCPVSGRAAVADKAAQRIWLCLDGGPVTGKQPMTTASLRYALPKVGTYKIYSKSLWSRAADGTPLHYFTAFAYGYTGARIGIHTVVHQDPATLGLLSKRGASAGCFRVTDDFAGQVFNFLAVGDRVIVITP